MVVKPNGFNTDYILKGEDLESYNLQLMLGGAEEPHLPRAFKLALKAAFTEAFPGYGENDDTVRYITENPGLLAQNETQVIGLFHPRTGCVNKWHILPAGETVTFRGHPRDKDGKPILNEWIDIEKPRYTKTSFYQEIRCLFRRGDAPARFIDFFMRGHGLTPVIKRFIPGVNSICIDIGIIETLNDEKVTEFHNQHRLSLRPASLIYLWMLRNENGLKQIRGTRSLQTATLVKTDDGYVLRLQYAKQNNWLGSAYWKAVNDSVEAHNWTFVPLWTNETNPAVRAEIDDAVGIENCMEKVKTNDESHKDVMGEVIYNVIEQDSKNVTGRVVDEDS
jgi:hypothetical protein